MPLDDNIDFAIMPTEQSQDFVRDRAPLAVIRPDLEQMSTSEGAPCRGDETGIPWHA